MRVLYFGTYERSYPRNAQVISCLRRAGVEVVERHEPVWEGSRENWDAGLARLIRLARAELRLARSRPPTDVDALIVGYPGHADVAAARRVAGGLPVVLNPLVSLADTLVHDRRRFRDGSLAARALLAADRYAFRRADLVVADTAAHARYFAEVAGLPANRLQVCFVGAEERVFAPPWEPAAPALFVGKLIPLHGLETVLDAARLAPEVAIRIVGDGQLRDQLAERPDNVEWIPWIPYERLGDEVRRAKCALGIFGTTAKAHRVIPNKVFAALACGTPVVTADTPAARELLADSESAVLVPPGDATALAEALRRLVEDDALAGRVAAGGLDVYRTRASEEVLGARWRRLIEELL